MPLHFRLATAMRAVLDRFSAVKHAGTAWFSISLVVAVLGLGLIHCASVSGAVLVSEDSDYRYFKGLAEPSPSDVGAWRLPGFDDATWSVGKGPFFYEDSSGYTGNTDLQGMRGTYTTVYLRTTFTISNPGSVQELRIVLQADDGCVAWINGTEVARVNMPEGDIPFNGTSSPASGEPNVYNDLVPNPASILRPGVNTLAIQAANADISGSSDFLIAASLSTTEDVTPPTLVDTVPAQGLTVRELTQIEVLFDESVIGVDAGDLLVDGAACTAVSTNNPRDYTFAFKEPAAGKVTVAFASKHGITDLASVPNAFAGASWTLQLDKTVPKSALQISEFMAVNDHGIRDEDGDRSDWIELWNSGTDAVDLTGWHLTDTVEQPAKWTFPAVSIGAKQYLLVWASNKNKARVGVPLHTNFKLSDTGEYLALVDPQGKVASEFAPVYPAQRPDVSYGRDQATPSLLGYFTTPTPKAANSTYGPDFAPDPVFSLGGGIFTNSTLTITLSSTAGDIRYTLDGSVPTAASPRYTTPLRLTTTAVVHARVFLAGKWPSRVVEHSYLFTGSTMTRFSSNLPILVVNTMGNWIQMDSRTTAFVTAFDTVRGRAGVGTAPSFDGRGQIEVRGQTSAGFPKQPYNLELDDSAGNDIEVPLLGLPAESDWVLYNPYSDKAFINNFLAYELHRKMGHYAPRCRFMEVFVKSSPGSLNYPDDYAGIYILIEKIKVDNNRVNIARLSPEQNTAPEITGGYIVKKDKDSPGDMGFTTLGGPGFSGQYLKFHEPKPREITATQAAWIQNYLRAMEKAMYATTWLTATGTNHYSYYLDADSFVDNHWIVEFAKQIDGYRLSSYFTKDRGGKLKMEPIWDYNLSFGNADYLQGEYTAGWYYPQLGDNDHIWLRRLIGGNSAGTSTGDPDFNQRIVDRWGQLRTNVLNSSNILARVDELAALLDEAQARDFAKWPRLGSYVWPNPAIYSTPTTYAGIISNMRNWIRGRYNWIDTQVVAAPGFSQTGGFILGGYQLAVTSGSGSATVYTTSDGTDPRAPGGALSASAKAVTGSLGIGANQRVTARARLGSRWSAPTTATFVSSIPPLVVSEIMYHPLPGPTGTTNTTEQYAYVELWNAGAATLDLRGFAFTDGIQFQFSTGAVTSLPAGQRVLVVKNLEAFRTRYGSNRTVAGEYTGSLANNSDSLTLMGPAGELVQHAQYEADWYPGTDGLGFALVTSTGLEGGSGRGKKTDWKSGVKRGGTPGDPEPDALVIPLVYVNEVLSHTDPPLQGSIELFNPNNVQVDIGGWFLSDDMRQPKYRIAQGTTIDAGGYKVFTEADFNPTPGTPPSFNLRATGDDVFLMSAIPGGDLTGYIHGFHFGAAQNGVALGRHVDSQGAEHFVAQSGRSLGDANPGPAVGPVVISEIMYHPTDVITNGAAWDNQEHEYIELHNVSSNAVALLNPEIPGEGWRLRKAVDYMFPTNTVLAANERVLVVSFNPTDDTAMANSFRTRYGLNAGIRLFGPYTGKLSNDGDTVELVTPELIRFYATDSEVAAIVMDRVAYSDALPWPVGADGLGLALQRINDGAFGDDPANWGAGTPTPGAAGAEYANPTITSQPASQTVKPGSTVNLSVAASGPGTLRYQWRLDGSSLPWATNATLTITNAQPAQSGRYQAVVLTTTGASASDPALVRIATPPQITRQPQGTEASFGNTVAIVAGVVCEVPMAAQWFHDGTPIAGATNGTLVISSARSRDAGYYWIVIDSENGRATTERAHLVINGDPNADSDSDGMTDGWEVDHGLDPRSAADASQDPDGDGMTNLSEYLAGTNPKASTSALRIGKMSFEAGITIEFTAVDGHTYWLEASDTAQPGSWTMVAFKSLPQVENPAEQAIRLTDPRPNPPTARYYRISVPKATP